MTMVKKITDGQVATAGVTGLCAGANVRTPCGERHVEFLRKGDLIVTRDNGLQPVRLVWTRTVSGAELAADPSLAPVTLAPRLVGPMMPQKALSVGGAHRLLIPGWRLEDEEDHVSSLVPARDFPGTTSQSQDGDITYYNIVFDSAQVFAANGLPVESFAPSQDSLRSVPKPVQEQLRAAFPDLGPRFKDYPATRYKVRERLSYDPQYA